MANSDARNLNQLRRGGLMKAVVLKDSSVKHSRCYNTAVCPMLKTSLGLCPVVIVPNP